MVVIPVKATLPELELAIRPHLTSSWAVIYWSNSHLGRTMGRKKQSQSQSKRNQQEELLETLGDFTSKENWDKFFTIRGCDDTFEWYAEWPELREPLLSLLTSDATGTSIAELQILVPGCGNSRLSEHLYDAGIHAITNIDFSKIVISDMLRRNVRDRPSMRWRFMDMTQMQFMDGTFDVVLDKGGLDALMEPEVGSKLGKQYLSEVKRVLKSRGKFICLTLAESHVLDLLFSKFRFGWKMVIHYIPKRKSSKPGLTTFMAVVEKANSSSLHQIVASFDHSSIGCGPNQVNGLHTALVTENRIREQYSDGSGIIYSLEDLQLGAEGDLMELKPGRRVQLILGGHGESSFRYRAVVLDAQESCGPFSYHCGVFLVQKARTHEWLFSSEEGQWVVVESSKAARLIMILLDSSHVSASMDEIQKDLSPLVRQLAPRNNDESQIPFMMAGDGIKQREIVHQGSSKLTGLMIVEDVVYESVDDHISHLSSSEELIFRRLVFGRTEGLVQSEALLIKESTAFPCGDETLNKKPRSTSKSKGKEKQTGKGAQQSTITELSNNVKVDHSFLASFYHSGIIAGFTLISSYLEHMVSSGGTVQAVVIGLGAGILPMFLHTCMPFFNVEAVELDPVVLKVAKDYFSFHEDDHLKVHIADGILFVRNLRDLAVGDADSTSSNGNSSGSHSGCKMTRKTDVIIIDVDSSDSSSGLSCPAKDFVEDSFFTMVKDVLSEQGLFIVNLVSRSPSIKNSIISRIKMVFAHTYSLQLEEDVNEVLFAYNSDSCIKEDNLSEAAAKLEKLLKLEHPERIQGIIDGTKKIKCLK